LSESLRKSSQHFDSEHFAQGLNGKKECTFGCASLEIMPCSGIIFSVNRPNNQAITRLTPNFTPINVKLGVFIYS
jgi:hypothetical protein